VKLEFIAMKKIFIVLFISFFQLAQAAWLTSFEDAQKMALATNKFIIIDFYASWCGPCLKMDSESWNEEQVKGVLENYVTVKIDIDSNNELAAKYGVSSIPHLFIVDGNGFEVYNFLGYQDSSGLKRELEKFALSTAFLSSDLVGFYKNKGFTSAIRISNKYLDYSLYVDKSIKREILLISGLYLNTARKELSKTDSDYTNKKQMLELFELYKLAYGYNFKKLDKKIAELDETKISKDNISFYCFLKYISAKGLNKDDFQVIEEKLKQIEGFDYFAKKADFILSKQG